MINYLTIALISHTSKVMLKILQARLQQYMNQELPDIQDGFIKGRGTRDQIASILWIIEKAREFQKNTYFCFIDYARAFDCVDHSKLWKILQEMGIPDHPTCLLRNLYAGQEATVWTGHGTTDRFQIGKGVHQGYCHPAYLSYMQSAAAAAKSLQSCPILCDPIDSRPPGSPVPGILQARTLEWAAISFSNVWKWKVKVNSLSRVRLLATPWTEPTRLLCPWHFPGKSTGVGCHCLLHICRVHHTKCKTGWSTSWNQDCWEKYQ